MEGMEVFSWETTLAILTREQYSRRFRETSFLYYDIDCNLVLHSRRFTSTFSHLIKVVSNLYPAAKEHIYYASTMSESAIDNRVA
ncbi:UNVERIFIED_CONTAM: hypothetical protein HDU68_011354, partial [Siphonaria sp. JEL0065]